MMRQVITPSRLWKNSGLDFRSFKMLSNRWMHKTLRMYPSLVELNVKKSPAPLGLAPIQAYCRSLPEQHRVRSRWDSIGRLVTPELTLVVQQS